ncbi:MAG: helix-turn-helix domain-containing protein [Verrucomicrobiales bacterium]|jgi:DNA-binding XRE family transcriptional regulator|nr:helix-turn-helix domain-containing protein [Verrucomicrobiales bacterium]
MSKDPKPSLFLARRLRRLREMTGLTQEGFAEHAGISYKVYQSIEAGRRWNLRLKTILNFAAIYDLTLAELFAEHCPKVKLKLRRSSAKRR